MKIRSRVLSVFLSILSVVFILAAGGKNEIGAVALVDGDVWKITKQGKGKKEFLDNSSKIFEGDQIITSEGGYIKILMNDDTVFDLGEASKFTFEEFKMKTKKDRKAKYNFGYGQMRSIFTVKSKDEKSLQIKTPDVVMGIRGTEFLTQRTDKTQVVLLEGKLNVKSLGTGKTIAMDPGNMFDSSKVNTKNLQASIAKIDSRQMGSLQIKSITDRGSFINGVMNKGQKFPVSQEMKKEISQKPEQKIKKEMKDNSVKEKRIDNKANVQAGRLNNTQKERMRSQFKQKMEVIQEHKNNKAGVPPTVHDYTDYNPGTGDSAGGTDSGTVNGGN